MLVVLNKNVGIVKPNRMVFMYYGCIPFLKEYVYLNYLTGSRKCMSHYLYLTDKTSRVIIGISFNTTHSIHSFTRCVKLEIKTFRNTEMFVPRYRLSGKF